MITPRGGLEPRLERPPLDVLTPLQKVVARIVGSTLRGSLLASYQRREKRLEALMNELRGRETRETLEQLLGTPLYAMSGELYSVGSSHPDVVEVYQKDGCQFEIWFKDGKDCGLFGMVPWSVWDIETGIYRHLASR